MEKCEKPASADAREAHTETPAPTPPSMNSLPDELLSHIFQHLDLPSKGRVCQVNRKWREEGYRAPLWRRECFTLRSSTAWAPGLVASLLRRRVRAVVIKSGADLAHAKELLRDLTSLEDLKIENSGEMNSEDLKELLATARAGLNVSLC